MDWKVIDLFHSFSLFLSFSLCFSIFLWLSTDLPTDLSVYVSICLSVYLSIYLSIYLSTYLSIYLSIYLIISLFIYITSEPPKVARTCGVLYILSWKCASRHNCEHFFNIRTSKSGANMWCFVHFDLEMCFAPQRRALFQHPNLQKWREHVVLCTFWLGNVLRATTACTFSTSQLPKVVRAWCVFCTFWLQNVLRATTACTFLTSQLPKVVRAGVFCAFWLRNVLRATTVCTFSTSQLPKVVRSWCALHILTSIRATTACTFSTSQLPKVVQAWCVLYILTSKCASCHNGVQIFISHLASWLRTRRFSEPTFRPSGAPNHWKNTVFRDFPTFSRICIFFLLTLSLLILSLLIFLFSLPLPCSAFHLSILSEVWLLNFLR